jgi:hypothetical protein
MIKQLIKQIDTQAARLEQASKMPAKEAIMFLNEEQCDFCGKYFNSDDTNLMELGGKIRRVCIYCLDKN